MDLIKKFLFTRPKENSGSRTANRFDYQLNFGLLLLIKNYKNSEDFHIVFDYHDDIVRLNFKEDNCENLDFFQVKSKKTFHDFNSIFKPKGKSKKSIALNIFENFEIFELNLNTMNLISNSSLKLKKTNEKKKRIDSYHDDIKIYEHLDEKEKKSLLKDEIIKSKIHSFQRFLDIFFYKTTSLPLTEYQDVLIGKLSNILSNDFNSNLNSTPLYNAIVSEARIKNNRENFNPKKLDDLRKIGISKNNFNEMINKYITTYNPEEKKKQKEVIKKIIKELNWIQNSHIEIIEFNNIDYIIDDVLYYYSTNNDNIILCIKNEIESFFKNTNLKSSLLKNEIEKNKQYLKRKYNSQLSNYKNYTLEILYALELHNVISK